MKAQNYRSFKNAEIADTPLDEPEKLMGGPDLWLAGKGVLEQTASVLKKFEGPYMLVGEEWLLAKQRKRLIQGTLEHGLDLVLEKFPAKGECCQENLNALVEQARKKKCRTLLGLGGGKCLDTVKLAAAKLKASLVTIPSSAATCAAASAISAFYNSSGEFLEILDLPRAPHACLVDMELIFSAGPRLLAAGMADTLAKWLELAPLLAEFPNAFGALTGSALAKQAYEIVLLEGEAALFEASAPGEAFAKVVEANLLLSALASCLGGGVAAAAHSFCNGLSTLPQMHTWLHGELVGLGLLFQDRLLETLGFPPAANTSPQEKKKLLASLQLPVRLPNKPSAASLAGIIKKMLAPDETIHLLPGVSSLPQEKLEALVLELCV